MKGLQAARELLGAEAKVEADKQVRARVNDVGVVIRFETRGAGSYSERWTEVDAEVAHRGLVLALRRQTADQDSLIAEGLAIDLQTRDAPFDAAFVVEAAPTEVALALLDADVRPMLLALGDVGLVTHPRGVRIETMTFVEDVERLRAMVTLATKIARKLPRAWEAVENAHAAYRGHDGELARRHHDEVKELERVQAERTATLRQRGCVMVLVIFAMLALATAALALLRSG